MNSKEKVLLYFAHVSIPLFLGTVIYLHSSGATYIAKILNSLLPSRLTSAPTWDVNSSVILRILRFYFCDAAWAYSLIFSVAPFVGFSKSHIFRAVILCSCFCILLELMQICPRFIGTFDPWDLIVEVITCIIAGLILYSLFGRK